jgi:hypothetical protein
LLRSVRGLPIKDANPQAFPVIIGTGFVVDKCGMVLTTQHVAEELQKLPRSARWRFSSQQQKKKAGRRLGSAAALQAIRCMQLARSHSTGPFYGNLLPDIVFI